MFRCESGGPSSAQNTKQRYASAYDIDRSLDTVTRPYRNTQTGGTGRLTATAQKLGRGPQQRSPPSTTRRHFQMAEQRLLLTAFR